MITPQQSHTALLGYLNALKSLALPDRSGPHNYSSIYDFALDRGVFFDQQEHHDSRASDLLKQQKDIVSAASSGMKFEPKQCFYNSQMLVLNDKSGELEYAEGWAIGYGIMPVHHGWAVFRGSIVVDVTWRGVFKKKSFVPPEELVYFGTVFNRDLIRSRIINTGWAVSVIDDYQNGWPVLSWPRINNLDYITPEHTLCSPPPSTAASGSVPASPPSPAPQGRARPS